MKEKNIRLQNKKAIDHATAPKRPKNRTLTGTKSTMGKMPAPHAGAFIGGDVDGGILNKRNK